MYRTANRNFFVGPSSTYHRDCVPHPARGAVSIDDMDPNDGRIVCAKGGVYYVYKLPNDHFEQTNTARICADDLSGVISKYNK